MATALFDAAGAREYLTGKAINSKAASSVPGMNDAYAIALASAMHASEIATGDTSLKLLQGQRDPKEEAQLYANYKGKSYTYDGVTYQPKTPGKSSGAKATTPNASAHSYGAAADVSGGSNPAVTVTGPAIAYMTKHRGDFGLENGSADLGIDDPAHFQIPQATLNKIKVAPGAAIPAANNLNLSAWTNAPAAHASQPNSALNAITKATGSAAAPVPMPGRPAALSGSQAAAPQPVTTPNSVVKLPSGKSVATGFYPSSNPGHQFQVADDGHGNGVVTHIQNPGEIPGVVDPLHESKGTIVGGIVQKTVQDLANKGAQQAIQTAAPVVGSATTAVANEAAALPGQAQGALNYLGSLFGGGKTSQPGPSSPSLGAGGQVGAPTNALGSAALQGASGASALHNLVASGGSLQQQARPVVGAPQLRDTHAPTNVQTRPIGGTVDANAHGKSNVQVNALAPAAAAPAPAPAPAQPQYTFSAAAQEAQKALTAAGYRTEADGYYGPATASSVRAFQQANGLTADGIIGPQTLARLQAQPARPVAPPPAPANALARPAGPVGVAAVANQNYFQTATGDSGSSHSGSGGGASNGYLFN